MVLWVLLVSLTLRNIVCGVSHMRSGETFVTGPMVGDVGLCGCWGLLCGAGGGFRDSSEDLSASLGTRKGCGRAGRCGGVEEMFPDRFWELDCTDIRSSLCFVLEPLGD